MLCNATLHGLLCYQARSINDTCCGICKLLSVAETCPWSLRSPKQMAMRTRSRQHGSMLDT